jgi:hypothetical protein
VSEPASGAKAEASAPAGLPPWLFPLLLALVGLLTQSRARTAELWQGDSDAAKYAALARSWPDTTLYDAHPYLIHPGGYPTAIRVLSGLSGLPVERAGSLLGGLCVTGLALLVFVLGRRSLGLSPPAAFAAGLLLLLSRAAEVLGQGVWREPLQTLGLYLLLTLALVPAPDGRAARRGVLVLAAALGALLGLTWDLFVLITPLLLIGAWALRRPPLLAAAVALLISWGSWASWRHDVLTSGPSYPAGIDGTLEVTDDLPLLAWLNPNFLPRTSRFNAYFWPREPTPLRPLRALAPWFCSEPSPHLTSFRPGALLQTLAGFLLLAALLGGAVLARAPPEAWRGLLLLALCAGVLGGPALIGLQARYGVALLPVLALLVGKAVEVLVARTPGRAWAPGSVALAVLLAVGWLAGSEGWSWGRPQRFEGRSVVAAIAAVDTRGGAVAGLAGLTPDLAWQLEGRRVVTLPSVPAWGLDELLDTRQVGLLVLPHEVHPWEREGTDAAWRDEVYAIPTLRALHGRLQAGRLTYLGLTLEAEQTDVLRMRAYDLIWQGEDPPAGFGLWLGARELVPLALALEQGGVSRETRRALQAHRPAIERFLAEPAMREVAQRILDAL